MSGSRDFFSFKTTQDPRMERAYLRPTMNEEKTYVTLGWSVNRVLFLSHGRRFYIDGLMVRFLKGEPLPIRCALLDKIYSDDDRAHSYEGVQDPGMAHYPSEVRRVPGMKGVCAVYKFMSPLPTLTKFSVECAGGDRLFLKGWLFRARQ